MIKRRTSLVIGLIFLSVFTFSLMITTPVFADDGVNPSDSINVDSPLPSSEGVASPPADENINPAPVIEPGDTPAESQETSDSSNDSTEPEFAPEVSEDVESSVVVSETANTELNSGTGNPSEEYSGDISPQTELAVALNESNLVLVNNQGEPVPLASNEAQVVSESLDPYFKSGADYIGYSTSGTCAAIVTICNTFVPAGTLISTAINAYGTTYSATASGAIFLEAGTYNENVIINSATNLTGLIGAGSNGNPLFGTVINGSISVQNTMSGFTLQGLNVAGNVANGLITFNGNTGALLIQDVAARNFHASGDGIIVTNQTGTVTLNKVESSTNGDEGASISSTGNVVITNSAFDRNSGQVSLTVTTPKSIVLTGVSSSLNSAGSGAHLSAGTGITINNGHFQNNYDSISSNNYGYGIYIVPGTRGAIILNSVFANANQEGNIFMNGVHGSVNMTDVEARSSSAGYGVYINNCILSGPACTSTLPGTTTLTNLDLRGNANNNLYVFSNGAINASNITASSSTGIGGYLENKYAVTPQNISVSNGIFSLGIGGGLFVYTKGNVSLNHIESSSVGSSGITIDTTSGTGTITILSTLGRNTVNSTSNAGLEVYSKGSIFVDGIDANSNLFAGILLTNALGSGSVTLKNAVANSNGTGVSNWSVFIQSKGAVVVSNLDSNYGNGFGTWIENDLAGTAMPVTFTTGSIISNDNDGLIIRSKGAVKVENVNVSGNNVTASSYSGMYITNLTGTGPVTVKNINLESNSSGITILSRGVITLDSVFSSSNDYTGAKLDNSTAGGTSNGVSIKNSSFNNNGYWGLDVLTKGPISISSTDGSGNDTLGFGSFGLRLDNSLGASSSVTLTGTEDSANSFGYNVSGGLSILTNGTVTINYANVIANGGRGIFVTNNGAGAVSLSNTFSGSNKGEGIYIVAKGTITLINTSATYNESSLAGIYLNNSAGTGNIIVKGPSAVNPAIISNNHNLANTSGRELFIISNGSVTLTSLLMQYSPENGLEIQNVGASSSVSLTSVQSSNNGGIGIFISSEAIVNLIDVTAADNASLGIDINNSGGTAKPVTITNATTNFNGSTGMRIISRGTVTLKGIVSNSNLGGGSGLDVDNSLGTGGISLSKSPANGNVFTNNSTGYGIYFITNGAVTISNTTVNNNAVIGIFVDNSTGVVSPITLNTVQSNTNNTQGIRLISDGIVTVSEVTASGNNMHGLNIGNTIGTGSVSISNSLFDGNINGNGLSVYSNGVITLTNVKSNYQSAASGAILDNSTSAASLPPGVTVQNSGSLMNSFGNNLTGLKITTRGPVKLVNITAESNTDNSVDVNNTTGTAGVTLTNIQTTSNNANGISVISRGAVTGTNLSGDGASAFAGIVIDNCQVSGICTGSGSVTLTKVTVNFSGTGLDVRSNGSITLSQLTGKQNNGGYGVFLDNSLSSISGAVSVSKSTLAGNSLDGLRILSRGTVTINGVSSTGNYSAGANGVYVENIYGTSNVVILNSLGQNDFYGNTGNGLRVASNGNIAITGVTSNENTGNGLNLITAGVGKTINLTTVTVKNNIQEGVYSQSSGAVGFTGLKVYDNGRNSNYDGIYVTTNGNDFTLANSFVSGNGQNGIDVTVGGLTQTVKIIKTLYFGNGQFGSTDVKDINTDGTLVFA